MSFLQKFIKPKWQHKDANIRKEALLALDPAQNQTIVEQLARTDPDSEIRYIAVKRIQDIQIIKEIAKTDADANVRDAAFKIITQTVTGERETELDLGARLRLLAEIDNTRVIESVAKEANLVDIRMAAFSRIDKPSLCIDFAVNDPSPEMRQAAFARITDKKGLEKIVKQTKNKDKHIHRDAKARLDEIIAEEEKPRRIKEERKRIAIAAEGLGRRGTWELDIQAAERLESEWKQLEGEPEPDVSTRYLNAIAHFKQAYQQYAERNAEQIEQEKKWKVIRDEKQSIIDQLLTILSEVERSGFADDGEINQINERYHALETQWQATGILSASQQASFESEFREVTSKIRKRISALAEDVTVFENLQSVNSQLAEIEKLSGIALEQQIKSITRFYGRVKSHQGSAEIKKVVESIDNRIQALNKRIEDARQSIQQFSDSIDSLLKQQKEMSQQGKLSDALEIAKKVRTEIKHLTEIDPRAGEKWAFRARKASTELNELNDWRKWVSAPKKEELIAQVEALIGRQIDPHEIARLIKEARDAWQKLGASDSSKELWERFNDVCNKAYEPCQSAFEKEAAERAQNKAHREEFLSKLETFLNSADWNTVDWKKVEKLLIDTRNEWRNLGTTDRKSKQELTDRYHKAVDQLRDRIQHNWAHNLPLKQRVVDEAKSLALDPESANSANKAKDLQRRWQTIGRVSQKDEHRLWKEFREACNTIFEKRVQARNEHAQQLEQYAHQKEIICQRLEQIETLVDAEFLEAFGEIKQLQDEWKNIPEIGKQENQNYEKRFRNLVTALEQLKRITRRRMQLQNIDQTNEKIAICYELENSIQQGTTIERPAMLKRWADAAPVDRALNDIVETRFQSLLEQASRGVSTNSEGSSLEKKIRELLVRYEILAEIDSPSEFQQDRIQYQMNRLATDIGKGVHIDPWQELLKLELEWVFVRNTQAANTPTMIERRERALSTLANMFPDELNNYA